MRPCTIHIDLGAPELWPFVYQKCNVFVFLEPFLFFFLSNYISIILCNWIFSNLFIKLFLCGFVEEMQMQTKKNEQIACIWELSFKYCIFSGFVLIKKGTNTNLTTISPLKKNLRMYSTAITMMILQIIIVSYSTN